MRKLVAAEACTGGARERDPGFVQSLVGAHWPRVSLAWLVSEFQRTDHRSTRSAPSSNALCASPASPHCKSAADQPRELVCPLPQCNAPPGKCLTPRPNEGASCSYPGITVEDLEFEASFDIPVCAVRPLPEVQQ